MHSCGNTIVEKTEVGPTYGPTWRLSHLVDPDRATGRQRGRDEGGAVGPGDVRERERAAGVDLHARGVRKQNRTTL
jgi:hypothetical protein